MRRFAPGWKTLGLEARLQAWIVNFADDFVICCRGTGKQAMEAMRTMMGRLKLTVNEEKTGRCRIPQERFDFLGYTFGRCYAVQDWASLYWYTSVEEEHQEGLGLQQLSVRRAATGNGAMARTEAPA
jgi:hypothetical protein